MSNNIIQNSGDGVPGIMTQNNLGPSEALSFSGNTISNNAGVGIWLYCNGGQCTSGSTISGNTFTGNAATGNECSGLVQDDNLGANVIDC